MNHIAFSLNTKGNLYFGNYIMFVKQQIVFNFVALMGFNTYTTQNCKAESCKAHGLVNYKIY